MIRTSGGSRTASSASGTDFSLFDGPVDVGGVMAIAAKGPGGRRLVLPMLGVALLGVLAWQGSRLVGARAETGAATSSPEVGQPGTGLPAKRPPGGRIRAEGRLVTYPG